jgi:hypothetical protein
MTAVSLTEHDAVSALPGGRCCKYVSEHYPELGRLPGNVAVRFRRTRLSEMNPKRSAVLLREIKVAGGNRRWIANLPFVVWTFRLPLSTAPILFR